MEGDRSQKSPVYVNNGPSVNKAKVIKSDSLRILYYNARSLLPKLDDLFVTIETHNFPDIVCIVESWLGHDVGDQEIAIPNYNIFRHDRNRYGGGILIYVKDSYTTSVLPGVPPDLEIITICVQSGNCKACLSLFYRPSSSSSVIFDTFCKYLESLNTAQFSNFILLGDFNVNFVNPSHPLYSKLCNIMSTYCLTQIVSECTHVHHNGSTSIIDLVFLSNPSSLHSCVTVPPLSNSDHNGLLTTMK